MAEIVAGKAAKAAAGGPLGVVLVALAAIGAYLIARGGAQEPPGLTPPPKPSPPPPPRPNPGPAPSGPVATAGTFLLEVLTGEPPPPALLPEASDIFLEVIAGVPPPPPELVLDVQALDWALEVIAG